MIQIIDIDGSSRSVYPRYAIQLVRKGAAKWVDDNTIQKSELCPILCAFPKRGDTLTIAEVMHKLAGLFPGDPYAGNKAAGALGGASRAGTIELRNGAWTRIR